MKLRLSNFFKNPKAIFTKKALFVLIPILIIGFLLYPKGNKVTIEYTQVKKGNIQQTVSASGILNGKNTATLKFRISGKLSYINVKTGDNVVKGQTIAGLDTQDLNIALQQAQNSYRSAQAAAEKAEDDVKNHSSDETFTQKQTRTQAQAARDSAYDSIKAAQRAFQDAVITSPIDGVITQVNPLPGQIVSTTDTIAQVVDWSKTYFDAEVDEADISKISVGQKTQVNLNSYPDKTVQGIVEEILPQTKLNSSGSTVIVVRINLHNPEINLVNGLNGQASIITLEIEDVLIIPQEALKDGTTVYLKTPQGIKTIQVKTGLTSDTDIEVIEGLNEGDQVVINPQAIKSGSGNTNLLSRILGRK